MDAFAKSLCRINLRRKYQGHFPDSPEDLMTHVNGVPGEELFHRMIRLERKRTERSGKAFVLMLVNVNSGCEQPQTNETLARVLDTISFSTRETDVIGWYRNHSTIGVIFTEVEGGEHRLIEAAILNNISRALGRNLGPEKIPNIQISLHAFPEECDYEKTNGLPSEMLYPDLASSTTRLRYSLLAKRVVDISGAAMGLIILAPVFVTIALLIKVSSRGPVLVKQRRIGRLGESFTFLKFRSMFVNSDDEIHRQYVKKLISGVEDGSMEGSAGRRGAFYKMRDDPRVTRIGRFLRRSSMDELPQLWNVLKGEMSLVGPRPPLPYEYECYDTWHKSRLLEVKPGITGLWQVEGRSKTTFDEMVRLDMKYIRDWSLWLDAKILLHTPWAVLSGRGAY